MLAHSEPHIVYHSVIPVYLTVNGLGTVRRDPYLCLLQSNGREAPDPAGLAAPSH